MYYKRNMIIRTTGGGPLRSRTLWFSATLKTTEFTNERRNRSYAINGPVWRTRWMVESKMNHENYERSWPSERLIKRLFFKIEKHLRSFWENEANLKTDERKSMDGRQRGCASMLAHQLWIKQVYARNHPTESFFFCSNSYIELQWLKLGLIELIAAKMELKLLRSSAFWLSTNKAAFRLFWQNLQMFRFRSRWSKTLYALQKLCPLTPEQVRF